MTAELMAPQPCHGCSFRGHCVIEGLVNRLAVEHWLMNVPFGCTDHTADNYHGVEGCRA